MAIESSFGVWVGEMIRLIRFLITGDWHLHEWELIKESYYSDDFGSKWTVYVCRCKHCGNVKLFNKNG